MKNQYFGDINDYLKYGLLRCCAEAGWNVGVCWMLTPDDMRSDGRKITYLSDPGSWRGHDPALFDALKVTINDGSRGVAAAEAVDIIPRALYFTPLVPESTNARHDWFQSALRTLSGCDLFFFDPDNGLQVPSKPKGRKDSNKYVFWDELDVTWNLGASLLIFQHFARENRQVYIERLARRLLIIARDSTVIPLITSNVLFLLASQPTHARRAEAALNLLNSRWGPRFVWRA